MGDASTSTPASTAASALPSDASSEAFASSDAAPFASYVNPSGGALASTAPASCASCAASSASSAPHAAIENGHPHSTSASPTTDDDLCTGRILPRNRSRSTCLLAAGARRGLLALS